MVEEHLFEVARVPLSILAPAAKKLREYCVAGRPREVCGAVYFGDIVVQYPNLAHDRKFSGDSHFVAAVDLKMDGKDIRAIWHSHPAGSLEPSETDKGFMRAMAEKGFTFHHIIATCDEVVEYEGVFVSADS